MSTRASADNSAWTDLAPVRSGEWTAARFRAVARPWLPNLRRNAPDESIRRSLLARINRLDGQACDASTPTKAQTATVSACARGWRSILHPRNESLAGFSVLAALIAAARGESSATLYGAFWADVCYLVASLEGLAFDEGGQPVPLWPPASVHGAIAPRQDCPDDFASCLASRMAQYGSGLDAESMARREARRQSILSALGAPSADWDDWRWQLRHAATDADSLVRLAALSVDERARLLGADQLGMPFGVTPYYASLFDDDVNGGRDRAVRARAIPSLLALEAWLPPQTLPALVDAARPFGVGATVTASWLNEGRTRLDLGVGPRACTYCQRWCADCVEVPSVRSVEDLSAEIEKIERTAAICEVHLGGIDPLLLSRKQLEPILGRLASIEHVERIVIESGALVTLPMRVTCELAECLGAHRVPERVEISVVTQFAHAAEVTPDFFVAANWLKHHGTFVEAHVPYSFDVSRRFETEALRRALRRCGVPLAVTYFSTDGRPPPGVPFARVLQHLSEEFPSHPAMFAHEPPTPHHRRALVTIRPNGARVYDVGASGMRPQRARLFEDTPILDYLLRLQQLGESPADYESIWSHV